MVEKKIKNALQGKGVRQVKKFHLQDERNLLHQDVLHDEPILPNQVQKGILAILMFHQMIIRQIKMTYHKLSIQYHPDRLPSLPNQQDVHTTFAAIANAYKVLKDPDKRREYDLLHSFHRDKPIGAAPQWNVFWGGKGVCLGIKGCNAPQATDFREKRNPPQADIILHSVLLIESKL